MKRSDVEKFAVAALPACLDYAFRKSEGNLPTISALSRAAVMARIAAMDMVAELDGGDWDDESKKAEPTDVGGAKVYKGPLSE